MLRTGLLWLSESKGMREFARTNGFARRFARRFVAGDTVAEGVAAVSALRARGLAATLDLLGEAVAEPAEAEAARDVYLDAVDRLAAAGLEVNVSVKLTQMGFDIDEALCARNVRAIVERAARHGGFVRLDMEQSAYTQRTLDFHARQVAPDFRAHCGVVIQSALRRSAEDVEQLVRHGVRVRLCKGAYLEPPAVAYPDKADVDRAFVRLMGRLMAHGTYPGIATHDERILAHAKAFARARGIAADRFEFQMLYGVRRDLQERLVADGWRVRVYVPFGSFWYPYLMRRLAERPANIVFILGNVAREGVAGR